MSSASTSMSSFPSSLGAAFAPFNPESSPPNTPFFGLRRAQLVPRRVLNRRHQRARRRRRGRGRRHCIKLLEERLYPVIGVDVEIGRSS